MVLSEGGRWAAVFRQCLGSTAEPGVTLHKLRVQGGSGSRVNKLELELGGSGFRAADDDVYHWCHNWARV